MHVSDKVLKNVNENGFEMFTLSASRSSTRTYFAVISMGHRCQLTGPHVYERTGVVFLLRVNCFDQNNIQKIERTR